ncbi:MAG: mechanosensitive ion channel family protein [Rhodospirillales bacterium]|nr:mechanosensitive ion channel family protein [Rhodospirillales bacterium]
MNELIEQFRTVWGNSFLGVTVGQLVIAVLVLLVSLLLRRFFARVVITRLRRFAGKTKTDIDDNILDALQQPLMFVFLILGLSFIAEWIPFSAGVEVVLVQTLKSLIAATIFWICYRLVDPVSIFFDKFLAHIAGPVANEVRGYLLKTLKVFIVGSGVIAVLAQWGINPWPYFAGLGILSLPFAFAAKDTVSNIFGGIKLILIDQVFRVGDWIETPSIGHGTVEGITLSSIKIRKFTKAELTVPNGVIVNEPITNWSRMTNRRIKMDLGLAYETSAAQFQTILTRVRTFIAEDDRVDHSVTEMVHLVQFSASTVDMNLYYFTKTTDWKTWRGIIEEHMLAFMKIIEEEGSSLAYPTQSIHVEGLPESMIRIDGS